MKTREEYLADVKHFKGCFASKFGIRSIGLFGSVARNEHHEGSDKVMQTARILSLCTVNS